MVKPSWPKNLVCWFLVIRSTGSIRSGRPDLARKRKKIGRWKIARWHFSHHLSHLMPSGLENVPEGVLSHNTSFLGILERERRERSGNKQGWKLENRVLAGRVPSLITLLNVFKGIYLWKLDAFHYFHVWGTQICRENILFRTKRPSFWCFKISVHLGF